MKTLYFLYPIGLALLALSARGDRFEEMMPVETELGRFLVRHHPFSPRTCDIQRLSAIKISSITECTENKSSQILDAVRKIYYDQAAQYYARDIGCGIEILDAIDPNGESENGVLHPLTPKRERSRVKGFPLTEPNMIKPMAWAKYDLDQIRERTLSTNEKSKQDLERKKDRLKDALKDFKFNSKIPRDGDQEKSQETIIKDLARRIIILRKLNQFIAQFSESKDIAEEYESYIATHPESPFKDQMDGFIKNGKSDAGALSVAMGLRDQLMSGHPLVKNPYLLQLLEEEQRPDLKQVAKSLITSRGWTDIQAEKDLVEKLRKTFYQRVTLPSKTSLQEALHSMAQDLESGRLSKRGKQVLELSKSTRGYIPSSLNPSLQEAFDVMGCISYVDYVKGPRVLASLTRIGSQVGFAAAAGIFTENPALARLVASADFGITTYLLQGDDLSRDTSEQRASDELQALCSRNRDEKDRALMKKPAFWEELLSASHKDYNQKVDDLEQGSYGNSPSLKSLSTSIRNLKF